MGTVAAEKALNGPLAQVGPGLLTLRESQWLERKSNRIAPRDLANELIGFANADGGLVIVGLHDGTVEGESATPGRLDAQMQANIDFCHPPVPARYRLVECIDSQGERNDLLVFEVDSSDVVHSNQKDEVFLRVGDENRRLGFAQRQELLYDKGQASYEARPLGGASIDLLDERLLSEYASAIKAPDPLRLLRARGLATETELTIAGCLLFADAPQACFPEAFVRVLRYRGQERGAALVSS